MAGQPFPNQNPIEVQHLRTVARTFSLLQGQRHSADYDGNQTWSRTDAVDANLLAGEAFRSWKAIRKTKIAQDYLLQFLVQR